MSYGYKERDEKKRQAYLDIIRDKDQSKFVYLDEAGMDDHETYDYVWWTKSQRAQALKCARRTKRLSMISALHQGQIKAPFVFEGTCTRQVFETYVAEVLVPELISGQKVILDNASFHKSTKIKSLITQAGCELLYLPPYSPDFNPIEHHWASIKHRLRQALSAHNRDIYTDASLVFQTVSN